MVSAPSHLLFIYLSSSVHLEIGNWKLDFLLVTCIPQFSAPVFPKRSFKELESVNGALQIQFEP